VSNPEEEFLKIFAAVSGLILLTVGLTAFLTQSVAPLGPEDQRDAGAGQVQEPLENRITLIPTLIGGVILGCGVLAMTKPETAALALHAATGVALLGGMGALWKTRQCLGQIIDGDFSIANPENYLALTISIICWSFILARVTSKRPASPMP